MDNMRVTGLRLKTGEEVPCSTVLSTVALQVLGRMIPEWDKEYCHRLRRIDYIGVVCGLFRLREPVTNAFWTNINDSRIPYNGIIEYTNLNRHVREALGGRSIVYIPYYLRTNSPRYEYSDEVLRAEFIDGLKLVNPRFHPSWVEDFHVYRERHAQAICTVGFANIIPDHRAPYAGLYLTDSTQYYPEDRTISAAIRLGRRVAKLIQLDTAGMTRLPVPVRQ
jgi:protoporphyrinogen oxidase